MSEYFSAFSISPVPQPGPGAVPPEQFRGIYGMPMFLNVPSGDLAESTDFWVRGLGFIDLFSMPEQITHLRRWAFQDVLLVPGEPPSEAPAAGVSFSCVLSQVDGIAKACEELRPGCASGPRQTPWNTVDVEVVTPENTRVIMTAARPHDPDSAEAQYIRDMGIEYPGK